MPIKPPNLDDRRYPDIVREARSLIPQYCPEWTNLGDADPGMTLVQLFAWMTEMVIYRLNRVPDKTYIHFLNFIGEERRQARPAVVPITFELDTEDKDAIEIPAFARCSTRPVQGEMLHFLSSEQLTVQGANPQRIVAVAAGKTPRVREIPFETHPACKKAVSFGGGRGVQFFKMDPVEHGPRAYTPDHFLYVAHDDFRRMKKPTEQGPVGKLRIRSNEGLPIGSLFKWEYYEGGGIWKPISVEEEEEQVLGLPEIVLKASLPVIEEVDHLGLARDPAPLPKTVADEKFWIRGSIDYERWLAHRMQEDLEITWRDDRGGEERTINNWDVRDTGRYLEFFVQDMPPIRPGWTVQFTLVDRSIAAGRNTYIPRYKWTYRRGDRWEPIADTQVRYQGTTVVITGPLHDMASDGFNLRAERVESVNVRGFVPDLNLDLTWIRPVVVNMAFGPESAGALPLPSHELPALPFQPANTLPPLLGMKFFVGSDLFENRAGKPIIIEIEVMFDRDGTAIAEPKDLYHMQLCYRAADGWRVVHDREDKYAECTFASIDHDPEGYLRESRRKIRIEIDPKGQLRGLQRAIIAGTESTWLRFELTRANLTYAPDKKTAPMPISIKVMSVKMGVQGAMGLDHYEEPLPGGKVAVVEYREANRRLSRVVTRSAGRLAEEYPFDTFIDLGTGEEDEAEHHALYMKLDRPFPIGQRLAMMYRLRGESYLPDEVTVDWEMLEDAGHGRVRWTRLAAAGDEGGAPGFRLNTTGVLDFQITEPPEVPPQGTWLRALFRYPTDQEMPALPPLTHLLMNTVDAVNLHAYRIEKFSGLGVPHQSVQLAHYPLYTPGTGDNALSHPDRFTGMKVWVTEDDGQRREWRMAPGNSMLTASKDDRVFVIDAVEGSLSFGNGIRGRMLPVGSYNVVVEVYHVVPGEAGNVGAGSIALVEGFSDVCTPFNLLPASGGRNAESIAEIIRRAPSVLTSRDRAVTRLDFEIIAKEASGEVARAACDGRMGADGEVGIVVLPHRREDERVPDPFLSAGLADHVRKYLGRRCLVNVQPIVRLATFKEVDVSVVVRLRPNANVIQVRERAVKWVETFLDPYDGGLDGEGWPFAGTLFAQDFGRMVTDIAEVRHVIDVEIYEVREGRDKEFPAWETGQGTHTMLLEEHDLFVVRKVRILSEEGDLEA